MNVYQVVAIFFIKVHYFSCYEYFRNIKPPDYQYSNIDRQRLNNIPSAIIPTSNSNLSNDNLDHRQVPNQNSIYSKFILTKIFFIIDLIYLLFFIILFIIVFTFSNEDPCAIILACSLLSQPNSQRKFLETTSGKERYSPYSGSLSSDYRSFETSQEDNYLLGTNTYLDSGTENFMVNKTAGHISQLCSTENVQR